MIIAWVIAGVFATYLLFRPAKFDHADQNDTTRSVSLASPPNDTNDQDNVCRDENNAVSNGTGSP